MSSLPTTPFARFLPSTANGFLRLIALFAVVCILIGTTSLLQRQNAYFTPRPKPVLPGHSPSDLPNEVHPIDTLIEEAEREWNHVMGKQSLDVKSAAQRYRERRGRHPPPGFDKWFQYASEKGGIIVEDFFDQIYDDLAPFWGVEALKVRQLASNNADVRLIVRNGNATHSPVDHTIEWMDLWLDLVSTIQEYLPDLDMPINVMDESRVVVPWEEINGYIKTERQSRKITPKNATVTKLSGLKDLDSTEPVNVDLKFVRGPYWDLARVGCPPTSPSRNVEPATDFTGPPPVLKEFPEWTYEGYVRNWTSAKDPCIQPELRESHGSFVEPISISTTHSMAPMFGGSKLPMNNEILIPPAMYWSHRELYTGGDNEHGGPWADKKTMIVWRGGATGGRNRAENWSRFQRHRFLSMINATSVRLAEQNPEQPGLGPNFDLQPTRLYDLKTTKSEDLSAWLEGMSDAGFITLICFPATGNVNCPYTDPYYTVAKGMKMKEMYSYKYLPDIDGNSFSGRYRGFLLSTSLPIKATIYSEWHDSRLFPWLHFVPMTNSFMDLYGILEYFIGVGTERRNAHDEAAERIATKGKEWAEKVLRREDMQIYVMRLLLEFARICDDKRENLGWVDDL